MIKLVIFDLWDTLAYKNTKYGGTRHILRLTHSKIPREKFVKIFERSVQTKKWKSKYAAYTNLCKNMGLPATRANIELLIKTRDYAEIRIKLFKHTISMLKKLRAQGYKIGLISNTSIFSVRQLEKKTKLSRYIDYPLFSFIAKAVKPDPIIFKKMLRIAKVKPKEAIMIGDTLGDDVIPPRKLGINAIHFKNYKQLKREFLRYGIKF
jgi:FMN phosphatase YigB (HAD superfamily)